MLRDPEHLRRAARVAVGLHAAAAVLGVLVCWVVWLSVGLGSGAWYPWPVWPTLGAGIAVAAHVAAWRAVIAAVR